MDNEFVCNCTLCQKRAGLPVEEIVIEYEKPVERAKGAPCPCRHCEALRAERA